MSSKRTVAGWIAGLVCFYALGQFIPDAKCRDGWASPSIGRRGACSNHGGVDRSGSLLVLPFIGISVYVGLLVGGALKKPPPPSRPVPPHFRPAPIQPRTRLGQEADSADLEPESQVPLLDERTKQLRRSAPKPPVKLDDTCASSESWETHIKRAICDGKRLQFEYCKYGSTRWMTRTVKPVKYFARGENQRVPSQCVAGICESRKQERTFLLRRMRRLRVID